MAKPKREPTPDSHSDCIYNDGNVVIYRQGYGFDSSQELTESEVAAVVLRHDLFKMLDKEGKSVLRGYL